jgi:3-oxoacyl-[acyl-carrier protein] reductase
MNISLQHHNAIVCGSTQGIGKACAIELAQLGAEVILVARDEAKLKAALTELSTAFGQTHRYIVADFSAPDTVKTAVHQFTSDYGKPIHILVNNTGGPAAGKISEASEDQFLAAFNAHLICNHIMTMAVIPGMKTAGYGRIINIISTSVKAPLPNLGVSNTIRAAVANWSKTMANELGGFNITVNNVLPGATKTERLTGIISNNAAKNNSTEDAIAQKMIAEIPMKRFGEAAEIANAVAFLASPAAAYINGINLPVDGGRTTNL